MLPLLLACTGEKIIDHPDDQPLPFPEPSQDTAADTDETGAADTAARECDGVFEDSRAALDEWLCLSFQDVASTAGLTDSGQHVGVHVFDYDRDGRDDVYVVNSGTANVLYKNTGAAFTRVESSGLEFASQNQGDFQVNDVAAADFDSDGDNDLLIATSLGTYFGVNSGGVYTLDEQAFLEFGQEESHAVLWWGSDVLIGSVSGIGYFVHQGGGVFVQDNRAKNIYDYDDIAAIARADIDGNGQTDFVALKTVGADRIFLQDGSSFTDATFVDETVPARGGEFVTLSPAEDVALSVTRVESDNFYVDQGDMSFVDRADELGLSSPADTIATVYGELAGDGVLFAYKANDENENELLIRRLDDSGTPDYFYNYAPFFAVNFNQRTRGAAVLDYDQDGLDDVVTVSQDGAIHLIKNQSHFVE